MTTTFSLYLDVMRFLAAIAVLLAHISSSPFTRGTVWWRSASYAHVAVTIFFVLSGYVISHVVSSRENSPREYIAARLARLYSVVGIGLVLTLMFDTMGSWLNPSFYQIREVLWKPASWTGYIASLFFVNEFQIFGFGGISPGTNAPYWSLSFEATYYLVAGLVLFLRPRLWIPISLIVLIIAGKTIAALLPIWAIGFFLHRVRRPLAISPVVSAVFGIASAIAILGAPTIISHLSSTTSSIWLPWGRGPFNRNLVADYFVCIATATHLACVRCFLSERIHVSRRLTAAVRWLGSLTFPLYCFHYPTICLLAAISPWPNTTVSNLLFICICTAALVVALTPLCDRLKRNLRRQCISMFTV